MENVIKKPLCLCGFTADEKPVIGGAFQLADTHGVPLGISLLIAKENGFVISLPHYFASAIENGWDDKQAFARIEEALFDVADQEKPTMEEIRRYCIAMFMDAAHDIPGTPAIEIGKQMRERIEADALARECLGLTRSDTR